MSLPGKIKGIIKKLLEKLLDQTISKYNYENRLRAVLEKYQIKDILDVGANHGQFAYTLSKLYKGRIISFEPLSFAYKSCKDIVSKKISNEWLIENFALGEDNYATHINISSNAGESSSLLNTTVGSNVKFVSKELIKVVKFDSIYKKYSINNPLVKIDVQGYELNVLKGMVEFVAEFKPVILLEVSIVPSYESNPLFFETYSFMKAMGYDIAFIHHNIRSIDFDKEIDVVFIPQK